MTLSWECLALAKEGVRIHSLFLGAALPPCSDKFVIARFRFWRVVAGYAGVMCKPKYHLHRRRNVPSISTGFSAGFAGSVLAGLVVFGTALAFDRVERVAGDRDAVPVAVTFFPLAMVVGQRGVNFCFPPDVPEFLCRAIFFSTEFICFSNLPKITNFTSR